LLIYLMNRYYDPATAQFLSIDPLVGLTQSAYGYVGDNPLNGVDPSGLWGWNPFQDIGQGWHDTLGQHWRGTVQVGGIVAGVAVAATGVGALAEGAIAEGAIAASAEGGAEIVTVESAATSVDVAAGSSAATPAEALSTGLSRVSVGFGIVSGAADLPDCIGDPSLQGCAGAIAGFSSVFLGGGGLLVEEGTILRGLLDTTSLGLGSGGLTWDSFLALAKATGLAC
jgi:hypothetical protein